MKIEMVYKITPNNAPQFRLIVWTIDTKSGKAHTVRAASAGYENLVGRNIEDVKQWALSKRCKVEIA